MSENDARFVYVVVEVEDCNNFDVDNFYQATPFPAGSFPIIITNPLPQPAPIKLNNLNTI